VKLATESDQESRAASACREKRNRPRRQSKAQRQSDLRNLSKADEINRFDLVLMRSENCTSSVVTILKRGLALAFSGCSGVTTPAAPESQRLLLLSQTKSFRFGQPPCVVCTIGASSSCHRESCPAGYRVGGRCLWGVRLAFLAPTTHYPQRPCSCRAAHSSTVSPLEASSSIADTNRSRSPSVLNP
jgi:hypothetical protein